MPNTKAELKNRGEILRRFEQQAPQDGKLLGRSGAAASRQTGEMLPVGT
ncbi:MAG: hypothetical protein WA876_04580 [Candidatus Acidiferrales bacterium]